MQHEETDVKTNKNSVLGCLIAAVCRNGPSHGQGGSRLHLRWPNWLLPRPYGLLIPPDLGSSPLFRACPAGSWEQLSFPRVLINPAPPCISYNKQSKLNRLVYEDSRQLGCLWQPCGQKAAAVLRAACFPSTSVVLQRLVPLCTGPPRLHWQCNGRPQLHCEARPGKEQVVKSHRANPAPAEREPTQPGEV